MRISDWSSDVCSSDLLVKPDDHHELEMVIRNLHRRLRGAARDLEPARPRQWMFDAARWSITTPTGAIVTLSLAEYTVIAALLARPGDAVSRASSDERRGGKECVSTCRSRGSPYP